MMGRLAPIATRNSSTTDYSPQRRRGHRELAERGPALPYTATSTVSLFVFPCTRLQASLRIHPAPFPPRTRRVLMGLLPSTVRQWLSQRNGSKRKLELLLGLSALTAGYLYVWVYQSFLGLTVKFVDLQTLLSLPIIALVVFPLVYYLWVRPD